MKQQDFEIINVAALARRLSRSRQWFYQRLNGNSVNGKPAAFTADEKARIVAELQNIQGEIAALASKLDRERLGWNPEIPSPFQGGETKPPKKRGIYDPEGWPKKI